MRRMRTRLSRLSSTHRMVSTDDLSPGRGHTQSQPNYTNRYLSALYSYFTAEYLQALGDLCGGFSGPGSHRVRPNRGGSPPQGPPPDFLCAASQVVPRP